MRYQPKGLKPSTENINSYKNKNPPKSCTYTKILNGQKIQQTFFLHEHANLGFADAGYQLDLSVIHNLQSIEKEKTI